MRQSTEHRAYTYIRFHTVGMCGEKSVLAYTTRDFHLWKCFSVHSPPRSIGNIRSIVSMLYNILYVWMWIIFFLFVAGISIREPRVLMISSATSFCSNSMMYISLNVVFLCYTGYSTMLITFEICSFFTKCRVCYGGGKGGRGGSVCNAASLVCFCMYVYIVVIMGLCRRTFPSILIT